MTESDLRKLADLKPEENQAARDAAINAGLMAFDAAQQKKPEKTQGPAFWQRLTAIFNVNSRRWTMDRRIAFGTLAAGVLLIPFAAQLMNSTSIPPLSLSDGRQAALTEPQQKKAESAGNDGQADGRTAQNRGRIGPDDTASDRHCPKCSGPRPRTAGPNAVSQSQTNGRPIQEPEFCRVQAGPGLCRRSAAICSARGCRPV